MNAAAERRLESALEASLEVDTPSNVVRPPSKPEDDIDRLAGYHRSRELKYRQHTCWLGNRTP